ncbi:catechol 2,3-dioxygenase-like lactoylglutathione lyase family enzyme [Streptomonospora nanhaiensis]|uniref:Catechol 2,3-dioxygenase-like lactoylglutathione lyase family enzyme n=1 Tax=Streptomonospora nanhaiensis TaxID=1323731 RepID=A0A853BQ87_9ACTN|nr:VOC family protein [Streptomonospora nanhaiensis]NYI97598.1 catechol 2,3-dioxygenase-like lactoylglutathione lyase family enzyme [Streptomonospora nanhaiensis]
MKTGHVALNVTDLARSTAFYREVFGLEVLAERTEGDQRFALLGDDGALTLALWQQSAGAFPTGRPGLHHLSFEVPDIAAVREAEAVLRRLGVTFAYDGIVPHGEGASSGGVFFTDPDGVRLEIYAPSGADTAPAPTPGSPTCGFF